MEARKQPLNFPESSTANEPSDVWACSKSMKMNILDLHEVNGCALGENTDAVHSGMLWETCSAIPQRAIQNGSQWTWLSHGNAMHEVKAEKRRFRSKAAVDGGKVFLKVCQPALFAHSKEFPSKMSGFVPLSEHKESIVLKALGRTRDWKLSRRSGNHREFVLNDYVSEKRRRVNVERE